MDKKMVKANLQRVYLIKKKHKNTRRAVNGNRYKN